MRLNPEPLDKGREFVLVHGACHGAWCWEAVAEKLGGRGYRVVALDLPGHGGRADERVQASVMNYARAVVDAMAREGVSRGIVVGHSMGGIVIPKVAELVAERVAHLVFLAAVVLPDGTSLFETHFSPDVQARVHALGDASANDTYLYPPPEAWARWMNDLPFEHPTVQAALPRLTPQPVRPIMERVDLTRFYALRIPRTYIRCLKDEAVPPDRAIEYARRLGVEPVDLDAAHDAMLSRPDALVEILERL